MAFPLFLGYLKTKLHILFWIHKLTSLSKVYIYNSSWMENRIPNGICTIWNAALSRIWTLVIMSISYYINHYTMSIFFLSILAIYCALFKVFMKTSISQLAWKCGRVILWWLNPSTMANSFDWNGSPLSVYTLVSVSYVKNTSFNFTLVYLNNVIFTISTTRHLDLQSTITKW